MNQYSRKVEEAKALLARRSSSEKSKRILLGQHSGKPFYLVGKDLENSIHIMGATREGKSKQFQSVFRQFIQQGIGCAFIDPHGYLYDDLVSDCSYLSARHPEIRDKVVLFDPMDDDFIVGLNTLQAIPGHDLDTLIMARMYATIKARGKDDFDELPTAKTWLYNMYAPLVSKGLTLMEARHLIDRGSKENTIVNAIVKDTGIDLVENDWNWLKAQGKQAQREELLSSVNMLRNFVLSERMELIFGRRSNVLDLRDIMDNGKFLLVNLSHRKLHKDTARLLGTLLVNEFFLVAKTRPPHSPHFYLAIDEFENYVTNDIADILDQGPKFGIHLILAHHSLEQLKTESNKVYAAVMQLAKIKLIYGGLSYEDAEVMVKEIFSYHGEGGIDTNKIKRVQRSPYVEPRETTRTIRSEGDSDANSQMNSDHSGTVYQYGESGQILDSMFFSDQARNWVRSNAHHVSKGSQASSSNVLSSSCTVVPFIEQVLKWFVSGVEFSSTVEQIYELAAKMKNLPQQVCMVKLPKMPVEVIKSNFVEEFYRLDREIERFSRLVNQSSPYHLSRQDAIQQRVLITRELTSKPIDRTPNEESPDDNRWQT